MTEQRHHWVNGIAMSLLSERSRRWMRTQQQRLGRWPPRGWIQFGSLRRLSPVSRVFGVDRGEATPMDDERIERRWFTLKEIEAGIVAGRIVDGKTMIGLYAWKLSVRKRAPAAR